MVIYQLLVRLFGNRIENPALNGTISQNGSGKFTDITSEAIAYIRSIGSTHIWLTGILEHASNTGYHHLGIYADAPELVKGKAGSPYAIRDFFDIDPDLANYPERRLDEFMACMQRIHQQGMGVIIDFIPNHTARFYHSDNAPKGVDDFGFQDDVTKVFAPQNNYYYFPDQGLKLPKEAIENGHQLFKEFPAKATGNDAFTPSPSINDWFETVKLNYGVDYLNGHTHHFNPTPNTWLKMEQVLLFWAQKGIDGFRCDMVEMVPLAFWHWVIPNMKKRYPNLIFIAEAYQKDSYEKYLEAGFDYLYDKVGLYDALVETLKNGSGTAKISQALHELHPHQEHLLRFIENHDEVRVASPFLAGYAQAGIPAMVVSALAVSGPAMIYNGQELGEAAIGASGFSGDDGKTTIFDYWNMPSLQRYMNSGVWDGGRSAPEEKSLLRQYQTLLNFKRESLIIQKGGYYELQWANANNSWDYDPNRIFAFIRHLPQGWILAVSNFSKTKRFYARVKIPKHFWELNGWDLFEFWQATDLFNNEYQFFFRGEEVCGEQVTDGIEVVVGPLAARVFMIKKVA